MSSTVREIGSTLAKLRALLVDSKKDLLQVQTLYGALEESLKDLWTSPDIPKLAQSPTEWKEFMSLIATGKVVSTAAQTSDFLSSKNSPKTSDWMSDRRLYSIWLGSGIASMASKADHGDNQTNLWKSLAELCGKAYTIGCSGDVVDSILLALVLRGKDLSQKMLRLLRSSAPREQRQFLMGLLDFIPRRIFLQKLSWPPGTVSLPNIDRIQASCAALIRAVLSVSEGYLSGHLSEWLLRGPNCSVELMQAAIAALPHDECVKVLEKSWQTFGDKLYTKHTPIVQQEALLNLILLTAGTICRQDTMQVFVFAHSSLHTNGISNRLSSDSERNRTLGMFLGTLVSQLVDKPETRMSFEFDEQEKQELEAYSNLLSIDIKLGSVTDLCQLGLQPPSPAERSTLVTRQKPPATSESPPKPSPMITVLDEANDGVEDDSNDTDLIPMARPDSDAEDSDPEDPSVARRAKPKAPVYIRDLLTQLQSTEDADSHTLALITAPSLIRRKAAFGNELADQALSLAAAFVNLQDTFAVEGWTDLRLRGLTALLVACPTTTGPWIAGQVFTGDLSASARVTLLTAIGLAARQLSGRDGTEEPHEAMHFASRMLPERLHRQYTTATVHEAAARRLSIQQPTHDMLDAMAQSRTKRTPRTQSARSLPNELAPLVASSFFFPLTAGAAAHMPHGGGALGKHVLPTLLQTMAVLLIHAGSAATQRVGMANELWELLLTLRGRAAGVGGASLEAVLFGFLAVLGVHEDKRAIVMERSRELLETQAWVEIVFERLGRNGGRSLTAADLHNVTVDDESQRVQTLAAGVLMACKDIVDAHNRLMLGDLAEFR